MLIIVDQAWKIFPECDRGIGLLPQPCDISNARYEVCIEKGGNGTGKNDGIFRNRVDCVGDKVNNAGLVVRRHDP